MTVPENPHAAKTVAQLFASIVDAQPDAPCIHGASGPLSYWNVASQARALAVGLRNLGVERGDRVAVELPNWPEFVISALAVSELGAVLVPLNPGYSAREMQFMLRNSEASVVITAEDWDGVDYLQLFESLLPELPDLQYLVTVGEEDLWYDDRVFQFEDLVSSGRGRELPEPDVDAETHPFAILYTPGTTGAAKGVMLSHASVVQSALATTAKLGMTTDDRTLCCVPLYNIFGLAALVGTLGVGASLVLQPAFDPIEALELTEAHEVSVLHGVPTMFVMMLREAARGAPRPGSLRTGIIAGAPVTEDLARQARAELVPELEIAYGLTETSPTVSITTPGDSETKRAQTVGRPLEGVEIRVLDEDGAELPNESVGQLAVRGYNVMQGYFRQPGQTAKAKTEDGFLKTGDLAMVDPDGYLHIVGRLSDVILRGGFSVHPAEIEALLRSHPAVEEAVVLGVPNDVLGELICGCVVLSEGVLITEGELRDFCYESLADYKVPDLIRFMDEFPEASTTRERRAYVARAVRLEAESSSSEPV